MALNDSLAARLKEARLQTAVRLRETVSQTRMAELIGGELRRTFHLNQWRRYEGGESEAPLDVISAAARLSGLSAGYIAFGTTSETLIDPSRDRPLTFRCFPRLTSGLGSARIQLLG